MGVCMEVTKAYLKSNGYEYDETEDGQALRLGVMGLDNMGQAEVVVIFDDDDESAALRIFNIGSPVPASKKPELYRVMSGLNNDFRWVKFSIDEDDDTIEAAIDAVLTPEGAGEIVFELVNNLLGITDEAYPRIMKALWGGDAPFIYNGNTLN